MDDIEQRLKDTSAACLESYAAWAKDKKDAKTTEMLGEAIHELRKVASRLEIELAVSERDHMTQNPIPLPSHRSGKKRNQNVEESTAGEEEGGAPRRSAPRRRRRTASE